MTPPRSMKAVQTSRYSGSPREPGSLVRSSTVSLDTVLGSTAKNEAASNGRYRRTLIRPTFLPLASIMLMTSCTVSQPEPMATMISVASGAPT